MRGNHGKRNGIRIKRHKNKRGQSGPTRWASKIFIYKNKGGNIFSDSAQEMIHKNQSIRMKVIKHTNSEMSSLSVSIWDSIVDLDQDRCSVTFTFTFARKLKIENWYWTAILPFLFLFFAAVHPRCILHLHFVFGFVWCVNCSFTLYLLAFECAFECAFVVFTDLRCGPKLWG